MTHRTHGSRRTAFTLVELLVVVLIIGVLAAIAIPKFGGSKDRAYVTAMKSDLRNLATAMEAYFNENNNKYATDLRALATTFRATTGVTVTLGATSQTAWSATAAHAASHTTCTISVGGSSPDEGVPICN